MFASDQRETCSDQPPRKKLRARREKSVASKIESLPPFEDTSIQTLYALHHIC